MVTKTKGPADLFADVIDQGLCTACGACIGACPYQVFHRGEVRRLDLCSRSEGRCYDYCPRTPTEMDAVYIKTVGQPFSGSEIGTVRSVFTARAKDPAIRKKAQYGGTVSAVLAYALQEKTIDRALLARQSDERVPAGFIAGNSREVLQGAGSSYMAYPALETLNRTSQDNQAKTGIVVTPCQALALAKMRTYPSESGDRSSGVKLVIGLFCTWALAYEGFYDFLKQRLDVPKIRKFDIPPPPANTLDVYVGTKASSYSLDEIRQFRRTACAYCLDMTAELTDISVGSAEGIPGWNTVIVRTVAGERVIEAAKAAGVLEIAELPAANLAHLKMASLQKKKRALSEIVKLTGSRDNLLYLKLGAKARADLLSLMDDQGGNANVNH